MPSIFGNSHILPCSFVRWPSAFRQLCVCSCSMKPAQRLRPSHKRHAARSLQWGPTLRPITETISGFTPTSASLFKSHELSSSWVGEMWSFARRGLEMPAHNSESMSPTAQSLRDCCRGQVRSLHPHGVWRPQFGRCTMARRASLCCQEHAYVSCRGSEVFSEKRRLVHKRTYQMASHKWAVTDHHGWTEL